jgi:hypothetical protein
MRARGPIALLALLLLLQLGASRGPSRGAGASRGQSQARISVTAPSAKTVEVWSFPVEFALGPGLDPTSLEVTLNGVPIRDRFHGGPTLFRATIDPGPPLRDNNRLKVRAGRSRGAGSATRTVTFRYRPSGKARAARIEREDQRIVGPLAHSRVGDWLLGNGHARFVVQDVAQRELYSVGQYGGNLIDAELVTRPGRDNFLEIQPGLNIETVVNAQSVEIVNDGEDGTAAVLRTCGPDDLLDFVNPSSQIVDLGIPFPPLADDRDLEIEGCTTYTLEPSVDPADPQTFLRIDTEVFNNDPSVPDPLRLSVGDWFNPAGELDTVAHSLPLPPNLFQQRANGVGPPVTTTLGALGFFGFDEAAGVDYALTQPQSATPGSFAFISGVLVVLHSDNVLLALLGGPPNFSVPLGGSATFTRFFGVGDGSGSSAFDLENRVKGTPTGVLEGCVTVAGAPVAGAKVSVGDRLLSAAPATSRLSTALASNFVTAPGPCPNYSGTVPVGSYQGAAALEGHLYEGGAAAPALHPLAIAAGATTVLDVDLPRAGSLRVEVADETGAPVPARVTVVGFDPSPEPLKGGPELPGFGSGPLGLFGDVSDRLPFGVAAVGYAGASGKADLVLEPGVDRYHVFVSRGTEYSAFRTASPVTIEAGVETVVNARIARVLDTNGFVSSDFHVHGIRSADSRVSDVHRVESYSAEGVENVIMTDHHVHTDLRPAIAEAAMGRFLTASIGEEITTFDYGHFNAYPLRIDPDSPHATFTPDGSTQLSGGSTDWAQAAPPGRDFPRYGALNATPATIAELATAGALSTATTTIQINHIDSHFAPLKIDTSLVPPADQMTDDDRKNRRLPDTSAVPNLFHHFPALELWNGDGRGDQRQFLQERIGIWFNHLSQGLRTTFIADTDSHTFSNQNTAGARTWTASPTDRPWRIEPADVAAAVDAGRAVGGQGVYVQTRLLATDGSGDVADLTLGGDTTMTDAFGNVELEIHVQSPAWARFDRVEIYRNAPTFPAGGSPFLFGAVPERVLEEGDCDPTTVGDGDFDVTLTPDLGGVPGADRLEATLLESFAGLSESSWFVVVVKGTDGTCPPMFPVYPGDLDSATNATLGDLVDGNVGEGGVMALGATNALYFEP